MSKRRFSKLQKWILTACLKSPGRVIARRDIIGRHTGFFERRTPTNEVVLSRSIWILIERGFITGLSTMKLTTLARLYNRKGKSIKDFENDCLKRGVDPTRERKITVFSRKGFNKVKAIKLTDEGKAKARSCLLLSFKT